MRYFLTKLTFNNHFDWRYTGPGNLLCILLKNLGFKNKIRLERSNLNYLKLLNLKSVFYGDLNYIISVFS